MLTQTPSHSAATTSTPEACTECRRPLLLANGVLMCCYRLCGEYGRDQAEQE